LAVIVLLLLLDITYLLLTDLSRADD